MSFINQAEQSSQVVQLIRLVQQQYQEEHFPRYLILKEKLASVYRQLGSVEKDTFQAARQIHGGQDQISVAAEVGVIDTALAKCSKNILVTAMSSN